MKSNEKKKEKDGDISSLLKAGSSSNFVSPGKRRMSAHEALQLGQLLSQQEAEFGTNMYQSLTPEDEPEIERLMRLGYTNEGAIRHLFESRFLHTCGGGAHHKSPTNEHVVRIHHHSSADTASVSSHKGNQHHPEDIPNTHHKGAPFTASEARSGYMSSCLHPLSMRRMSSGAVLQLSLMLSEQEAQYGVNMYDALEDADETVVQQLMAAEGCAHDEAVLRVFQRKVGIAESTEKKIEKAKAKEKEKEGALESVGATDGMTNTQTLETAPASGRGINPTPRAEDGRHILPPTWQPTVPVFYSPSPHVVRILSLGSGLCVLFLY